MPLSGILCLILVYLTALILIVPILTLICVIFVPERYFKVFRFGALLLLCCFFYHCGAAVLFDGYRYRYWDTYPVTLKTAAHLYEDSALTVPSGYVKAGTECIAVQRLDYPFVWNPGMIFKEKYQLFCEHHEIGWAKLGKVDLSLSSAAYMQPICLMIMGGCIIVSLWVFFLLFKSEKKSFDAENQSEIQSDG